MRSVLLLAGLVSLVSSGPKPDVAHNNDFALSMYGELRAQHGNVFFSPVSLREALGTADLGARGDTALEMQRAVRLEKDVAQSQKDEATELKTDAGSANLTIANRVWIDKAFVVKPTFPSGPTLDFQHDVGGSRTTINDWVAKQTNDKIKDLLPDGSVSSSTKLVITNAVWFKGDWASAFKPGRTTDDDFLVDGVTTTKLPMMHQTNDFLLASANGAKMLEMNYAKSDLAMDVILPDTNAGLSAVEDKVVKGGLDSWTNAFATSNVAVSFPKVKITWGGSVTPQLQKLGMTAAFDDTRADFTGISDTRLKIDDVVHKAFVAIDEKGTEAAAATGIVMDPSVAIMPSASFVADHPFLIVIRDLKSKRIVFMGRVTNPKG